MGWEERKINVCGDSMFTRFRLSSQIFLNFFLLSPGKTWSLRDFSFIYYSSEAIDSQGMDNFLIFFLTLKNNFY